MFVGLSVTGIPDLMSPNTTVSTVMVLGVALAATVAALAVRAWGRDPRIAIGGGLLYGFAPGITSVAVGYIDIKLLLIPPIVFLLLNEMLMKRRQLALLYGAIGGVLAASTTLHTTPALISAGLSVVIGVVVIALFRPSSESMALGTVIQAALGGLITYVLLTAYPPSITTTGTRSWSVSFGDNGGYVRRFADFIIPNGSGKFGGGGVGAYLLGGLLIAGVIEALRRANLRWSLLPIGAVMVILLMNLFPRLSVHL